MQNLRMKVKINKALFKILTKTFKTTAHVVEQEITKTVDTTEVKSSNQTFIPMFNDDSEASEARVANFDTPLQTLTEKETYTYYTYVKHTETTYSEVVANGFVRKSLSKSAIKQFLLYCFMPANNNYIRKGVRFKQIADYCKISVPAVKANHAVLQELGFIYSTPAGRGKVDIAIPDEYKLHRPKKDGGIPYLTMSIDMLETLLNHNSINDLRVELEKIRRADAQKNNKVKFIHFNKEDLISTLPNYIKKSKKLLSKVLNSKNSLFPVVDAKLDVSNYEHQKAMTDRLKAELQGRIELLFELHGYSYCSEYTRLTNRAEYLLDQGYYNEVGSIRKQLDNIRISIIDDFCKLGCEFGVNNIIAAIQYMFRTNCYIDEQTNNNVNLIDNPGAFLRTELDKHISKNGSLKTISI